MSALPFNEFDLTTNRVDPLLFGLGICVWGGEILV